MGRSEQTWEKAMATHSSTLAWKIPWTEEPGRPQSMGSLRVGHDWATSLSVFTFHFRALEKGTTIHSSVLAWRIPGMGASGGLPSMGSHSVGHDCSDLAAAAAEQTYRILRSVREEWSGSCHCHHYYWSIRLMEDSSRNPGTWLLTQHRTPSLPGLTPTRTAPVEPRAQWGRGNSQLHTLALIAQYFSPCPCVPDQWKGP